MSNNSLTGKAESVLMNDILLLHEKLEEHEKQFNVIPMCTDIRNSECNGKGFQKIVCLSKNFDSSSKIVAICCSRISCFYTLLFLLLSSIHFEPEINIFCFSVLSGRMHKSMPIFGYLFFCKYASIFSIFTLVCTLGQAVESSFSSIGSVSQQIGCINNLAVNLHACYGNITLHITY